MFPAVMVAFVVEKPTVGTHTAFGCAPSGVATCRPHSPDAPPGIAFMAFHASVQLSK